MPKIYYHFTGDKLRNGDPIPAKGEWLKFDGEPIPCKQGLHASATAWDALGFAPGPQLHRVYLGGVIKEHGTPVDKYAAQKRKIIATIDTTELCRAFARRVALDVLHLWNAPPAVKEYLETGNEALRDAAWAAARDAAWAAARDAAWAAAWAAARAAARDAARDAARAAARDAARAKYAGWFNAMVAAEFKKCK